MSVRGAFTAVETLVAIALLLVLSAALTSFLYDVQDTRERLSILGDERLAGSLVIEAIEEAARFAVASGPGGAGVSGDRTTLRITSQRVDLDAAAPSAGMLAGRRTRTIAWDEEAGVLALDGEPLTDRVRRLVIRYHDDTAWRDRFDSRTAQGLPVAIEIAMWFGEPGTPGAVADGITEDIDLGEGFGLPTPRDLASLDGPTDWGEPDRRRVIAVPRLRPEDTP
ncbi:MAG: hypothetical protein Tsb0013_08650 [Phycisphaerales bacterium]